MDHHHQQPPQYHHYHHHQGQKQQQKQYQRRKRSPPKKEEDISGFVKMEKRFKNDDHQDLLVTNLENVFFSDDDQEQQFTSLIQQQVHESSLMEVIKVLQDQINTVSNITNSQDNQFSSSSSTSPVSRFVSEPLISYSDQESCGALFSDSSSTVMASTDLVGIEISHLLRYSNDDQFYQLFQYSKILSLNFAYFSDEDVGVDNDQKIGNNNQVCNNQISVSDYLVDRPVDVCVDNNGGGCDDGETDDEWIERVLNEVSLASESHQVVTEMQ